MTADEKIKRKLRAMAYESEIRGLLFVAESAGDAIESLRLRVEIEGEDVAGERGTAERLGEVYREFAERAWLALLAGAEDLAVDYVELCKVRGKVSDVLANVDGVMLSLDDIAARR